MSARVLIVDDSNLDRFFIKKLLEYLGVDAFEAPNGKDCLRKLRNEEFDLILMDYLMPVMNAVETIAQIRGGVDNKNESTPIVALVSPDDPNEGKLCLQAGFSNYLEKPVEFKQLIAVLIMYLPDAKRNSLRIPGSSPAEEENDYSSQMDEEEYDSPIMRSVSKVKEIDHKQGASLCGSEEGYITALGIFYNSINTKADEIENYYNAEDWKNYTIKVHALKSSANIIGAKKLWADAKALEDAGNNNNLDKIKKETKFLLEDYRSFLDKLSFLKPEEEDNKPPVDPQALQDAYKSLDEFIGAMDFDLADMVIQSMKEFKLPDADADRFGKFESLLSELKWDDMRKVMDTK